MKTRHFLILLTLLAMVYPTLSASAETKLMFRIENNNRFLSESSSMRLQQDLRLYLLCAGSLVEKGQWAEQRAECLTYKRFVSCLNGGRRTCYPDLRGGADRDKFQTNYVPAKFSSVEGARVPAFKPNYVWNNKRTMQLALEAPMPLSGPTCTWYLAGRKIGRNNCKPISTIIRLRRDFRGGKFEFFYSANARVEVSTGDQRRIVERKIFTRDFLIVAMGDSYASGEGNPNRNYGGDKKVIQRSGRTKKRRTVRGRPAEWLDYRCNRPSFNYSQLFVSRLAQANPAHSFTLVDVTCSGAEVFDGVLSRKYSGRVTASQIEDAFDEWSTRKRKPNVWTLAADAKRLPTQAVQVVRAIRRGDAGAVRNPDLVVLQVGGNDLGFGELLRKIILKDCNSQCQRRIKLERADEASDCNPQDYADRPRLKRSMDCLRLSLIELSEAIVMPA